MLQTETQPCFDSFSVPGKVFLLGEYAVLSGRPALVAAIEPRFSLSKSSKKIPTVFHAESPAGRLLGWSRATGGSLSDSHFEDPFHEEGGMGGSTAEFALAYISMAQKTSWGRDWKTVWKLYRELMNEGAFTPSGADLVAQWQGGVLFFDPSSGHCLDLWAQFDWSNILVFSATRQPGRKVRTHEHLKNLTQQGFPDKHSAMLSELDESLLMAVSAVRSGQIREFGQAMNAYAKTLSAAGLEAPSSSEDRRALSDLPGVWGVKGSGALLSDAVIILLEPGTPHRSHVIEAARKRGLVLVSDGLTRQPGVLCQRQ